MVFPPRSHSNSNLVQGNTLKFAWNRGGVAVLNDLEGRYALRFKTHASFGAHHENLNEDRPILSAMTM